MLSSGCCNHFGGNTRDNNNDNKGSISGVSDGGKYRNDIVDVNCGKTSNSSNNMIINLNDDDNNNNENIDNVSCKDKIDSAVVAPNSNNSKHSKSARTAKGPSNKKQSATHTRNRNTPGGKWQLMPVSEVDRNTNQETGKFEDQPESLGMGKGVYLETSHIDFLLCMALSGRSTDEILMRCEQALLSSDVNNVTESYLIAAKFGMRGVMDKLIQLIRDNFISVTQTRQFLELPADVVELFLSDTFVNVADELDVFTTALRWIDYNKQERICQAGRILNCVRYDRIRPVDIRDHVEPNIHLFNGPCGPEALINIYRKHALALAGPDQFYPLGQSQPDHGPFLPASSFFIPGNITPKPAQEGSAAQRGDIHYSTHQSPHIKPPRSEQMAHSGNKTPRGMLMQEVNMKNPERKGFPEKSMSKRGRMLPNVNMSRVEERLNVRSEKWQKNRSASNHPKFQSDWHHTQALLQRDKSGSRRKVRNIIESTPTASRHNRVRERSEEAIRGDGGRKASRRRSVSAKPSSYRKDHRSRNRSQSPRRSNNKGGSKTFEKSKTKLRSESTRDVQRKQCQRESLQMQHASGASNSVVARGPTSQSLRRRKAGGNNKARHRSIDESKNPVIDLTDGQDEENTTRKTTSSKCYHLYGYLTGHHNGQSSVIVGDKYPKANVVEIFHRKARVKRVV